jgi:hypothetical protein
MHACHGTLLYNSLKSGNHVFLSGESNLSGETLFTDRNRNKFNAFAHEVCTPSNIFASIIQLLFIQDSSCIMLSLFESNTA